MNDVAVAGHYLYIAGADPCFRIVDCSDPLDLAYGGSINLPVEFLNIDVTNRYAFLIGNEGCLYVIDFVDPIEPVLICRYRISRRMNDLKVVGERLYAVGSGLVILDISDLNSIKEIELFDFGGVGTGITVVGERLLVTAGTSGLYTIDCSDPVAPWVVSVSDIPDNAQSAQVRNEYAYVADGRSGVRVISIADPANPVEKGFVDTPAYARSVCLFDDYCFVTDEQGGLRVLDISNPSSPQEIGFYNTPGFARGMDLDRNGLIYVADYTNLGIYDVSEIGGVGSRPRLLPSSISLSSYPNPFNALTTVSFSLPHSSDARLGVFDLMGRNVTQLLPSGHLSAGQHSAVWDASGVAAGNYIIRLQTGEETAESKVTLVK